MFVGLRHVSKESNMLSADGCFDHHWPSMHVPYLESSLMMCRAIISISNLYFQPVLMEGLPKQGMCYPALPKSSFASFLSQLSFSRFSTCLRSSKIRSVCLALASS